MYDLIMQLTLSTLSIWNGMVRALIWNLPYRSVGVKWLRQGIKVNNHAELTQYWNTMEDITKFLLK